VDATNFLGWTLTRYPEAADCTGAGADCGLELALDGMQVGVSKVRVSFQANDIGDRVRVITPRDPTRPCRTIERAVAEIEEDDQD
jgi:hypothetical protein